MRSPVLPPRHQLGTMVRSESNDQVARLALAMLGAAAWVRWRDRRPLLLAVLGAVWSSLIFFAHVFGLTDVKRPLAEQRFSSFELIIDSAAVL